MPCRHEGGKDACIRGENRDCLVNRRMWKDINRDRRNCYGRAYSKKNHMQTSGGLATPSDAGEAAELLVGADLLTRGLPVTKPLNRNGSDDLHVKVLLGWKSVQVKLGQVNKATGSLHPNKRKAVTSDIFAVVDLVGKRIKYLPLRGQELPPELL